MGSKKHWRLVFSMMHQLVREGRAEQSIQSDTAKLTIRVVLLDLGIQDASFTCSFFSIPVVAQSLQLSPSQSLCSLINIKKPTSFPYPPFIQNMSHVSRFTLFLVHSRRTAMLHRTRNCIPIKIRANTVRKKIFCQPARKITPVGHCFGISVLIVLPQNAGQWWR